jgi:hypothetical protein
MISGGFILFPSQTHRKLIQIKPLGEPEIQHYRLLHLVFRFGLLAPFYVRRNLSPPSKIHWNNVAQSVAQSVAQIILTSRSQVLATNVSVVEVGVLKPRPNHILLTSQRP